MAGFIPQEIIQQIIDQTDIVSLIEEYVKLNKKSSANYFGLCPFHSETKPSFSVSPGKQIFYCFSCQRGGNAIKFIQDIENLSFPEAVRFLADKNHIKIPDTGFSKEYEKNSEERKIQQALHLEAARFFYRSLHKPDGLKAKQYMKERGYSEAVMKSFGIGYADSEWDSLTGYLTNKGFSEEDQLNSGIVRKSSRGNLIDLFRNRIMIPIFPSHGEYIIGFGGRTILDSDEPKYINSPETILFQKGSHLFAMNLVRKLRPLPKEIIVCEGYMDVIAMHQAGYRNAVASLGTALTERQVRLIDRYVKTVILAYDSDRAGQEAALRAMDMFAKVKAELKVLDFGDAKDPDNYIKKYGIERFDALYREAETELDFKIKLARKNATDQNGNLSINEYSDRVCAILAKLDSEILIELYAKKLAEEISVSYKTILYDIGKRKNQIIQKPTAFHAEAPTISVKQQAPVLSADQRYEYLCLILLASYPELFAQTESRISTKLFTNADLKYLANKTIEALQNQSISIRELIDWSEQCAEQTRSNLMRLIFYLEDDSIKKDFDLLDDVLNKLEQTFNRNRQYQILKQLNDKEISDQEREALLQELSELSKK